ncbi:MAG: HAMP domain-containing histidine kinase [Prevotellaceae bacterium]|nr:HAMP domain-containing histidine kinase [Prevotellaceae bacterium]
MTIRRRLALRYAFATCVVFLLCLIAIYVASDHYSLNQLHRALYIIFAVALVVLAVSGYLLSRSSLEPINRLAEQMENLSAEHIGQRLPISEDGTEVEELTAAINALLDRLEASFTSQKMFVSNVSHELRTPLATIIGGLDLALQRQRPEEYYQQVISVSLHDAWEMSHLIDELLDLAKADYASDQVKMEEIRLDELLIDVRENLLRANPGYQIELLFGSDSAEEDDSGITVRGNVYLLRIAFSNLIENNCKYSDNHTSFVQISFWQEWCTLLFSDNGMGMTDEEEESLFNLFYRGEDARSAEGHGIGMTLAQKIVLMHQGEISVRSEKGEGTTFLVRLRHI